MIESVTSRLVPILCVGAGITTALLIGRGIRQTEAGPDLAVKAEFDQLPAAEQTLVLGKAESLQRRWDANPDEYRRLKDIHDAVTAEPELYDKLVRFHQWWLELDFGQKSQLKSDGQFAVNWPERTQRLYVETQTKPRDISVRLMTMGVTFTEDDYQAFLGDLIPEPPPEDLAGFLSELDGADQECEQTLVKSLWLYDHVDRSKFMSRPPREEPEPEFTVSIADLQKSIQKNLISEGREEDFQRLISQVVRGPMDSRDPRVASRAYFMTMVFVRAAIHHFDKTFREKHLGDERTALVSAFAALSDYDQSDLLRSDPEDVQQYLRRRVIEEQSVQEKDSAVARLAEKLNRLAKMFPYPYRPGYGRRGERSPGGGQGGGFRSRQGMGPGAGPDDGRRPPDDGGRPPEDRSAEKGRGPGHKPGGKPGRRD